MSRGSWGDTTLRSAFWLVLGGWVGAWFLFAFGVSTTVFRVLPTTELAGPLTVYPGDVVRYDGGSYSLEFDSSAEGVPATARSPRHRREVWERGNGPWGPPSCILARVMGSSSLVAVS